MYTTIVNDLNMIDSNEKGPERCEVPFSFKEIDACVQTVKSNKAAGIDTIHNEVIKHAGSRLVSTLVTTFNSFWQTENTPSVWAKASIHLIYKGNDSDMLEAASYRPISLSSNISKLFEKALLMRMEANADGALPEEQAGFRKDRSCADQIFILREIIESRRNSRLPTYACFIDLKQAFPSTWRDAMWHRLRIAGISGKMYRTIRALYMNTESAIITPYGLTDSFTSDLGTRQGAVLSPFLFSLVISPIVDELHELDLGVRLGTILIPGLLYADDIILLAETPQQLSAMLDHATHLFHDWRFTVSDKKSQIVILGNDLHRKKTNHFAIGIWLTDF